ncbi:MAG: hypothetical protein HUJ74_00860 [Lachnospiraceae bacterium]|nr:hypothetical protein [Lachnospiraceae bacterium]
MLAYLKTINNEKDNMTVRRIINMPKRGIYTASIEAISHVAENREISFYEIIHVGLNKNKYSKNKQKLLQFFNLIEDLKKVQLKFLYVTSSKKS